MALTFGAAAFAQRPVAQQQEGGTQQGQVGRGGRRHGPGMRGGGPLRLLKELNLTDAQRQQVRAIHERAEASTRAQREELRTIREGSQGGALSGEQQARVQALRDQIEQSMRGTHQEVLSVLTAEQRTQFEQMMKERKARRDERRGRRLNQPGGELQ